VERGEVKRGGRDKFEVNAGDKTETREGEKKIFL
jgi:hypothetical protein